MIRLSLAASLLAALPLAAAERQIQMKDLPAAVQQAVQQQTSGAEIKGISQEKENGRMQYEVETRVAGKSRDLTFDGKGTLVEVEQEVDLDALPSPARAAIEKRAAGGKIVKVESIARGGVIVAYEGAYTKGGRSHEVSVNANGAPIKD